MTRERRVLALMLAPANRQNVGASLGGWNALFIQYQAALTMWLTHGLWPSLAVIGLGCYAAAQPDADRNRLAFALGLLACSLVSNFLMAAASYYPERAFTGSVIFLIAAGAVTLSALPHTRGHTALANALALGLSLVMVLQLGSALPNAYNRYQLAQARVQAVCTQRDAGQTDIATFGILGRSRFDAFDGLNELTTNPEYFPNRYFARYYGLNSIVAERFE